MHSTDTDTEILYSEASFDEPFSLESGIVLPGFRLAYTTLGQFVPGMSRVVWVFHALTANSNPAEWWPGLVGTGKMLDPAHYFVICVNMPGSCYGSLGPIDQDPGTDRAYLQDFPFFTPRDMARAYMRLRDRLGIEKAYLGIGGSMGGQQLLEWAVEEPEFFEHLVPLATNAVHSAWGRAFNATQRSCIETDPSWKERQEHAGMEGMKVARSVALISYRHYKTYELTQVDAPDQLENYRSASYQRYQGEKLARRFNAISYYKLSLGMDAHDLGRHRGGLEKALHSIRSKTLVIGIRSDILFPIGEQELLASHIPGARLELIESNYGHDGFLLEYEQIGDLVSAFLETAASR